MPSKVAMPSLQTPHLLNTSTGGFNQQSQRRLAQSGDYSKNTREYASSSSLEQLCRKMGAYFDCSTQKLEIPPDKKPLCNKTQFKRMRRYYWGITQQIQRIMSLQPSVYKVNINISKVNLYRLRPYIYINLKKCFYSVPYPINVPPMIVCITETVIGLIKHKNYMGKQVEDYLLQCCASPLACRKYLVQIWEMLLESSFSDHGVADNITQLELKVQHKDNSVLDYAMACCAAMKYIDNYVLENSIETNDMQKEGNILKCSLGQQEYKLDDINIHLESSSRRLLKGSDDNSKEPNVGSTSEATANQTTEVIHKDGVDIPNTSSNSNINKDISRVSNLSGKIAKRSRRRSTFGRCSATDRSKLFLQLTEMKKTLI
ncbi:uncharacterized protein TRIADDRAFT_52823 [Trichoplax adhaerens]|uniref:Uncharacterized protein n=1 Tax=Trichoplax adhaerens TaxID=10228 RepID=B3RKM4_TRIAD|nr:predicted protein [Trichoplax adhaerens]EDV29190.1 predicted protein [Trichoplax adhaerens]|eukprot:XP_002108392.1 predicted protein [Trichoplax adhaerens]